ncbi:hypothetical protein AX16_006777 [Volvariella volvacea WC 439]|nr:hypothetical protein AX16_006777 [Volvariella volvacea WC 439]
MSDLDPFTDSDLQPNLLNNVFGEALIGIILAAALYGIYTAQVWSYYNKYSKDNVWLKSLVGGLWVMLTAQFAINIHMIYVYLIRYFGDRNRLTIATWDFLIYLVFVSVAAIIVQGYFARRLFLFARHRAFRWLFLVVVATLSLVQFVFGIVTIILATDKIINKLMMYSIQTGAITSITEIFCLATFTVGQFHHGHILVIFPLSALYTTSFLANLHARKPNSPERTALTISTVELGEAIVPSLADHAAVQQKSKSGPLEPLQFARRPSVESEASNGLGA